MDADKIVSEETFYIGVYGVEYGDSWCWRMAE